MVHHIGSANISDLGGFPFKFGKQLQHVGSPAFECIPSFCQELVPLIYSRDA